MRHDWIIFSCEYANEAQVSNLRFLYQGIILVYQFVTAFLGASVYCPLLFFAKLKEVAQKRLNIQAA